MFKKVLLWMFGVFLLFLIFPTQTFAEINRYTSMVVVDKTSVVVNGSDSAQFIIYAFDNNNQPLSGVKIYFASDRGTSDVFFSSTQPAEYTDPIYYATTDLNGQALVRVKSNIPGTARIAFGIVSPQDDATSIYQFLIGNYISSSNTVGLLNNFAITFTTPYYASFFVDSSNYIINGEVHTMNSPAFLKDGHVFVPFRCVAEALSTTCGYVAAIREISFARGDDTVYMFLDSNCMAINNSPIMIDTEPFLKDGQTFIPIKYIFEAFGYYVDEDSSRALITKPTAGSPPPGGYEVDDTLYASYIVGQPYYFFNKTPSIQDVSAFYEDSHVFTVARSVADVLGAQMSWDEATQSFSFTKGGHTIYMFIGAASMMGKNHSVIEMDTVAKIIDGRVRIPLKYVFEAFGYSVVEDSSCAKVYVSPPSNNAYLNSITLSEGTLEPGFSQDCLNYEVYVNNNISSIDITSATSHAGGTLTIDGTPVTSGDPSIINLAVGENTIDIVVTAEDGVTTKTYQVVIYRSGGEVAASNSSAEINAPLTKNATRNITVTLKDVGNNLIFLTEKTLNLVVNVINNILDTTEVYSVHDDATVNSDRTVLKTAITDVYGKITFPVIIPALVDPNDGINIAVKTEADELIEEFSYINTPSSNAELSGLTVNSGSLSPAFQAGTLAYTASVTNSVSSITFALIKAEANASYVIKKNGASEGVTGNTVSLDVGNNVISIIVTAQDGIATKEYTITVTRAQADTGGGGGGGSGGGGSSGGGGTGVPPAQPPVQTPPSKLEKVYPGIGNPVTADDKKINESLQTTGSAKVDVTGSSDNTAYISGQVINQLNNVNKPIIIANQGVQVNIASSNLNDSGENSTVRIGVNPLTEEGRDRILESSEWGQSTGIFAIGGQIFDLSAQIDTTQNGTTNDTQKIENFTEPVGVTIDLSGLNLTEAMINELCGVRLEKDAQGNTVFVKLGGFYNPANQTFTFYTERFSQYSIMWTPKIKTMSFFVGADVVRINQNYKKIDAPPRIIGNRTMVPLRFIGEALGATLDWDEKTRTVTYTLGKRGLKMTVDVKLPGQDMPPIIINGRTMVPLRYVSEYLGAKVTWFPSNKMVTVVK